LSKLIKSSYLCHDISDKVSIKVTPVFSKKPSDNTESTSAFSIEHINKMIQDAKMEASGIINQAAAMKESALQEMEEQRNSWIGEKEKLMEQAYSEGHKKGFQDGKKEAFQQYSSLIEEAKLTIELALSEHDEKVESSMESIVTLGMKVAEKIVAHTIDKDSAAFSKMVQAALKEVKEREQIKILVNPKQYPLILENKQLLQNMINSHYELSVFPEADLPEYGCWIDSSAGRMEVSVQTQLKEIKEMLLHLVKVEPEK
jgi:flagellar assembly protein FliH